jgi:DNA helicase II / ATP-dependent DNA helicase PcrA
LPAELIEAAQVQAKGVTAVDAAVFLDLVDEVLVGVGRPPLDRKSAQPAIITVDDADQVLQILAGPGSGKTEMLVWRMLYELVVRGTSAERVLITTFTRKAATELEVRVVERLDALLFAAKTRGIDVPDPHVHDVRIGTIHSLCDRLLRELDSAYMAEGAELIDEYQTAVRLARQYRFTLGFESRPGQPPRLVNRLIDREMLTALFRAPWDGDRWPGNNMDRVAFVRALLDQHTETWLPRCGPTKALNGVEATPGNSGVTDDLIDLHEKWMEYLDSQGVMDFASIQERFLEGQAAVAKEIDHVFVDEFQDTNPIQLAIHTGWLKHPATRLTVVGDDDQALYRWRGSDINCFIGLEDLCTTLGATYRREVLERNYRSTRNIVAFTEGYRTKSILGTPGLALPKAVRPAHGAQTGPPVRLLVGDWTSLTAVVAAELKAEQAKLKKAAESDPQLSDVLDAAILLFSTSEKVTRINRAPAVDLRSAIETRGLRVYNPHNKIAGRPGSPVHDLIALISYLIDPVTKARVNGRLVEVHASCREADRWPFAIAAPPPYRITDAHASFQKQFRKSEGGGIDRPSPLHADLLAYVDAVRQQLVTASKPPRLTLSALVARLLSKPRFRNCGYTASLFRQALFTALLEANIAPSRRSLASLDAAMNPVSNGGGQIEWPKQFWQLLDIFGGILHSADLDDVEVEAFAENAVAMLTFHQAKGLEFEHVYVGCTGRNVTPQNVLRTMLFSGEKVKYTVSAGQVETKDKKVLQLAQADREREVYVAMTRAKRHLTILYSPNDQRNFMPLNPGIAAICDGSPSTPHPLDSSVQVHSLEFGKGRS